uniref:ubiquitinyl hydrolase 1 n=1 Tax=Scleropages formosus TaxID=113540 RepID=A0A8C9V877_SCLFO
MQKALKKYFSSMDEYLGTIGLYRKMTARDASCLFRAVSEQLYRSQRFHHKVRQDCVTFMRANRCNFEPFVEGSFEKYLERLEDPTETAGQVEIKALSLLYRRVFVIYRYPGKQPTEIAEERYPEKILLCCSNNGHYDIVYPRTFPVVAALCQALVYELLYCRVMGVEEGEVHSALESFRCGGRRYRNSASMCSEDAGYDTPDDRSQRSVGPRGPWSYRYGPPANTKPKVRGSKFRLSFPYKVLKSLDPELYRNVEFDVWHDGRKELQKTDYMVFAGRHYYLGDKCQVRLEPKGKYYNAFIQEVGTHSSAVTVFIEELGEKHLVSLTNLKPVNPVPAWNVSSGRKGASFSRSGQYQAELDSERGKRRFFKKARGKEIPAGVASGRSAAAHGHPAPGLPYDHYRSHPAPRPPRGYGAASLAHFLNRHHLMGPDVAYCSNPGKRCYQSYDNYSYRSRRSRRQMHSVNKECQFSFVPEASEDPPDMEGTITFYEIQEGDEPTFPPLPGQAVPNPMVPAPTTFWVQRGHSPIPAAGKQAMTSSEEDPDERSNSGERGSGTHQSPSYQSPSVYTAAESTANLTIQEGASRSGSPPEGVATYSYSQQVVVKSAVISSSPVVNAAPAAIFTSNSSSSSSSGSSQNPPASLPPSTFSVPYPPTPPWFINEMGETVSMAPPPPYSYDPNGNDLPQDCKVLQYYFNLGVQWYQQTYWQPMAQVQQVYQHPGAEQSFQQYPGSSPAADPSVPQPYPETGRAAPDGPVDVVANGTPLPLDTPPSAAAPATVFYPLVQEQCGQPPLHTYEPYVPVLPATYHYLTPWTPSPAQPRLHASFCPTSSHPIGYVTAPAHHGHFVPPSV